MTPKMNVVSQAIELRNNDCDEQMPALVQRWAQLDCAGLALSQNEGDGTILPNGVHALQDQIATLSASLAREQVHVLSCLSSYQSKGIEDVLSKLGIWMSIVCPTEADRQWLQPADQLIASAVDDLQRLFS